MRGPFPGMDPYLEHPDYWPSFHARLIFHLGSLLQEVLPPEYVAEFEQRVELVLSSREIIPDVAVLRQPVEVSGALSGLNPGRADEPVLICAEPEEAREHYIEILHLPSETVVAVLEVSSPTNKVDRRGREAYREKQRAVLASDVHLIEIDLLRRGGHWASVPEEALLRHQPFDYLVCISRAGKRDVYECYFRTIRQPLPQVGVPLATPDPDVVLDLQAAFDRAYTQGRLRGRVSYGSRTIPPLGPDDEGWADGLLRDAGLIA
jgi:hypothetical protein